MWLFWLSHKYANFQARSVDNSSSYLIENTLHRYYED